MSEDSGDTIKQRPCEEVSSQDYLGSLNPDDRKNIIKLQSILPGIAREVISASGVIVAVGKSVARETRGRPRKDLDIVVVSDKPVTFSDIKTIADRLHVSAGFRIKSEQEPYFDRDYDFIPMHSGSVTVSRGTGIPIELVPEVGEGPTDRKLDDMRNKVSTSKVCRDFSVICRF